ncbi:hypothetical protein FXO37_11877 [Capsicum annuum]|nr:hypothetical protein FXO37_11877 [Capsicum annuum]
MSESKNEMDDLCAMLSECNLVGNPREWWMDSGSTRHICANKELFAAFALAQGEEKIYLANFATTKVEGIGKVCLKMTSGNVLTLNNVLITSIRMLIALAAVYDLEIYQMNVKTTFLNVELEGEIYMEQPEGFVVPGKEKKARSLIRKGDVISIMDPALVGHVKVESVWRIAEVAIQCVERHGTSRPRMHEILSAIQDAIKIEKGIDKLSSSGSSKAQSSRKTLLTSFLDVESPDISNSSLTPSAR